MANLFPRLLILAVALFSLASLLQNRDRSAYSDFIDVHYETRPPKEKGQPPKVIPVFENRVMVPSGIKTNKKHYLLTAPKPGRAVSSASLFSYAATVPARLTRNQYWDLRWLTILYCGLLLSIFWLGLGSEIPATVVVLLSLVVYDPSWAGYCASLRSETPMLLGFLGALFCLFSKTPRPVLLLAFATLGSLAKPLYVLFPVCVALLFFLRRKQDPGYWAGKGKGTLASLAALFLISYVLFVLPVLPVAKELASWNRYNRVFVGATMASSHPAALLSRWGISQQYWVNEGSNFLNPVVTDEALHRQLEGVTYGQLALAYLGDFRALNYAAREVDMALTTYERPDDGLSRFSLVVWVLALARGVPLFAFLTLLPLAGLWPPLRRRLPPLFWGGAAFFSLAALSQIPAAVLGDGFQSLPRHLALAQFALQLSAAWGLGWYLNSLKASLKFP